MSALKSVLALALTATALARPDKPAPNAAQYNYQAPSAPEPAYSAPHTQDSLEYEPLMPFDFGYTVEDADSDNSYAHSSNSDGQQVTGSYRVLLPDCRTQVVTYTADRVNGYQAQVTYEGEICEYQPPARDQSYEAPQPAYSAPQPAYSAPQPAYEAPEPSYETPQRSYIAPSN